MGEINVKEKDIVVPGDILASGMDYLPTEGTFREGDKVIASQVGIATIRGRIIKVIPLSGSYIPKRDDIVIGKVIDMSFSSWFIDVGYAYDGVLSIKDASSDYIERGAELSDYFAIGDVIVAKVSKVNKAKAIDLTMKGPGLRKIFSGKVIEVTPQKVPRVVGKQGSMISMIKEHTNCQITVAQNGRIWIDGKEPAMEMLATDAIRFIEANSHKGGLTETVKEFLVKGAKK